MVQGQVFLKKGELALFQFSFFPDLSFAKLCYALEEKLFFSGTIIL